MFICFSFSTININENTRIQMSRLKNRIGMQILYTYLVQDINVIILNYKLIK